jgi:GH18 family chitinase
MDTMQERIDALIKMRKEKPEYTKEWETLKSHLIRIIPAEKIGDINQAFQEIEREEALDKYDQQFHEVLITGKFTDKRTIAIDNRAYLAPATASSIASNTVRQTLTDEMIKLYAQHKEKQDKKKTK